MIVAPEAIGATNCMLPLRWSSAGPDKAIFDVCEQIIAVGRLVEGVKRPAAGLDTGPNCLRLWKNCGLITLNIEIPSTDVRCSIRAEPDGEGCDVFG